MFVNGVLGMFKKLADGREYVLVLPHTENTFAPTKNYGIDGLTERLRVFRDKTDLDFAKRLNKYYGNLTKKDGGGIMSLLYSCLLTRGLDRYLTFVETAVP